MKFKRILSLGCLVLVSVGTSQAAIELAKWNFEVNTPSDLPDSAAIGSISSDLGSGIASGVHATGSTDWTTPVGNGSGNSFSANTWAIGDYFQFRTSLSGYQDVVLSWEQTRSGTGPSGFKLAYSTDGLSFADVASYSVLAEGTAPGGGNWSSNPLLYRTGYSYSFDLSAFSALNNAGNAFFRLVATTAPGGSAGTVRVDDFAISAAAVPEPSTWVAGVLLALPFGVQGVRYLRNRKRA